MRKLGWNDNGNFLSKSFFGTGKYVIRSVEVIEATEVFKTTQILKINNIVARITVFRCFEKQKNFE